MGCGSSIACTSNRTRTRKDTSVVTAGQKDALHHSTHDFADSLCLDSVNSQDQLVIAHCRQLQESPVSPDDFSMPAGWLAEVSSIGAIRWVKGSWLQDRAQLNLAVVRRQEMLADAYVEPQDMLQCWRLCPQKTEQFLRTERNLILGALGLFGVAISYCWCSATHPDPDCFHLMRVAKILEGFLRFSLVEDGWADFSFFWDYMSIFQVPRSAVQEAQFKVALNGMQLVYGHDIMWIWKLVSMPTCPHSLDDSGRFRTMDGSGRSLAWSYEGRGWPTFESATANARRRSASSRMAFNDDITMDNLTLKEAYDKFICPGTAIHPDRFDALLRFKTFTNGSDVEVVSLLYRRTFEVIAKTKKQNLQSIHWTDEKMQIYFEALGEMQELEVFLLMRSPDLGVSGVRSFLQQLTSKRNLTDVGMATVGLTLADRMLLYLEFPDLPMCLGA